MKYKLQKSVLYAVTLVVAVLLLIAALITSLVNQGHATRNIESVHDAHEILAQLYELDSTLNRVETEQRGYIVTGEDKHLESYEAAKQQVQQHMELLRERSEHWTDIQGGILKISLMTGLKIGELDRAVATRATEGFNKAQDIEKKNIGTLVMNELRSEIQKMIADGRKSLNKRQAAMAASLRSLNLVVIAGGVVGIGVAGVGTFLLLLALRGAKRAEALHLQKRRAERSNLQKSRFLANMSHEIRTPMNAILGFAELLDDTVERPKEKHYVRAIRAAGQSLLALINDILDLSKVEAGKLEFRPAPASIPQLAESMTTLFGEQASKKGLSLEVEVNDDVPSTLVVDQLRLRQILMNLLGNAIKFTTKGTVKLGIASETGPHPGQVDLHISVIDTGRGISESDQRRIFRPFRQAKGKTNPEIEGTGLGLSICQRLAVLMRGSLSVESAPGEGSCFTLILPNVAIVRSALRSDTNQREAKNDLGCFRPAKILVVDDNAMNRDLLADMLDGAGHHLSYASNGLEAIEVTMRERPDVVLMDIRMPVMDGRLAREAILADSELADTPIIAVTASSMTTEEEKLRKCFDGYIRKPLQREDVVRELAKFLPKASEQPPRSEIESTQSYSRELTEEVNERWPEMLADLRKLEADRLPYIRRVMGFSELRSFADEIVKLGQMGSCHRIIQAGVDLRSGAEAFNLSAVEESLDAFTRLVEDIQLALTGQDQPAPSAAKPSAAEEIVPAE